MAHKHTDTNARLTRAAERFIARHQDAFPPFRRDFWAVEADGPSTFITDTLAIYGNDVSADMRLQVTARRLGRYWDRVAARALNDEGGA